MLLKLTTKYVSTILNKNKLYTFLLLTFLSIPLMGQDFTKEDVIRGSITPERAWWDLLHYDLEVEVFPSKKTIKGKNTITYKVLKRDRWMQIDLQSPMKIDKATQNGKKLSIKSKGNAQFIKLPKSDKDTEQQLTIHFSGQPRVAVSPPWDGGFSWEKDANGKDFIATSNQGIGSSVWWPSKDHPADEPQRGVNLAITAPAHLIAVGNGRLEKTVDNGATKTWHWKVINPINSYAINVNIGDYARISEKFEGLDGILDMDYWVLKENLERAKEQFTQAPMMMRAFEYWFGPYPFYEDSYKLVDVPYLGMEHQSSVTYGNNYENGYLGRDLSGSGWGLRFDFIIIHESGHEWFANSITNKDVADMWIHEGFTAYSENLFLSYHFSDEAASEYVIGTRANIQNDRPIIGTYGVSHTGSGDMYYKGANILHTLRQLVDDDRKWKSILTNMNKTYRHKNVSSSEIEKFLSEQSGIDLSQFWDQYLRTVQVPLLEYKFTNNKLSYRYTNVVENFNIPLKMIIGNKEIWISPTSEWKTDEMSSDIKSAIPKPDFYIDSKLVK